MIRHLFDYKALVCFLAVFVGWNSPISAQVVYYEGVGEYGFLSEPSQQFTVLFGIDPNAVDQENDPTIGDFFLTSASMTLENGASIDSGILQQVGAGGTLYQDIKFDVPVGADTLAFRFSFEQARVDPNIARQLDLNQFRKASAFRLSDFESDDEVNASFRIVGVPEASSGCLIGPVAIGLFLKRRRRRS